MKKNRSKLILNIMLIMFLSPLLILCVWSLTSSWAYPNLLPQKIDLRAFEYILNKQNLEVLLNSLWISISVSIITVIISIPASKAICFYEFRGRKFFEILILSPIIFPLISVAIGIHVLFIKLGIANTMVGVILINILPCLPYAVRIISDVYAMCGERLEIQAKMLGASSINVFRHITFPLILPGIVGAMSMSFIISFSQYFLTMLIGGGRIVTYPMVMFPYIQSGDRTIASMYSMVFLIVSLIVLVIVESMVKRYYKHNI